MTRLPFPVHVSSGWKRTIEVSRNRFVTRYTYHHGYFDGVEREFRGFGLVDQFDTEELGSLWRESDAFPEHTNIDAASHVPPALTRPGSTPGVFVDGQGIFAHLENEYWDAA